MASPGDGRGTLSVQTAAPAVGITGIKVPPREYLPRLTVFCQFLSSMVSSCQFTGILTTFGPIAPSAY